MGITESKLIMNGDLNEKANNIEQTVQESINKLNDFLVGSAFEKNDFPNPNSDVEFDTKNNKYTVKGGTFSVDGEIHEALYQTLESGLKNVNSEEVEGGNDKSTEVRALKVVGDNLKDLHAKYSDISNSVEQKIKNLHSLQLFIKDGFNKLYELTSSCNNDGNVNIVKEVEEELFNEVEKQLSMLQKMLKVSIKPTKETLIELLKKNKDFAVLAEKLGVGYNNEDASDRLALVFTNISQLSAVTDKIKNALQTLNISLKEYSNIKNMNELKSKLTKVFKDLSDKKDFKLNNIMEAIALLENNQKHHDDIVKCLENHKNCSIAEITKELHKKDGGVENSPIGRELKIASKSSLEKRVLTYEKAIRELFKNFMSQMNLCFTDIQKSIKAVSEKIGSEIEYNDNVQSFVKSFLSVNENINNEKIFYALLGLDNSISGKELKNRFMDNINEVIKSLNALNANKYFKEIQKQLVTLKENIDVYSDTILNIKKSETKQGSSDVNVWTDKLVEPTVSLNVIKLIKDSINMMNFYGNIAQLRSNLKRMNQEQKNYQKDYDVLLGKAIGVKLNELNREYVEATDRLNDPERGRGYLLKKWNESHTTDEQIPKGLVETIYKLQYEAKEGLYKTLEAIDLYLMHFTDNITQNPDAVKDLNKMLEQTTIISKWYNNNTKANLDKLFDENLIPQELKFELLANGGNFVMAGSLVNNKIKSAYEQCKKSIESLAVLKNIISIFIHIGEKYGNQNLTDKLIMSPNVIYKNLVKYIWVSAFSMGSSTGGDLNSNGNAEPADGKGRGLYDIEKGNFESFFTIKFSDLKIPGLDVLEQNKQEVAKLIENVKKSSKVGPQEKLLLGLLEGNKWDIFSNDDKYFILMLKSMVAKVFTVLGTHKLFNKPEKKFHILTNPVRTVLGGASDAEINPEAVELYIRLPLLIEFYKKIFNNGNSDYKNNKYPNDDTETIAFIPEVGSLWSGLIMCIFDDSKYIHNNGIYSVENMKVIVNEVNKIYQSYSKSSKKEDVVKNCILDLVAEINRRYGILKKKDINDFYQIQQQFKKNITDVIDIENNVNYDILDEANDYEQKGPSSMFVDKPYHKVTNGRVTSNDMKLVKNFRDQIHKIFTYNPDLTEDLAKKSLADKIKYYHEELKNMKSNDSKFDALAKAIDDTSNINIHNIDMYVMFHELVVYPLAVLVQFEEIIKNKLLNISFNNDIVVVLQQIHRLVYDNNNLLKFKFISPNKCIIEYSKLKEYVEKAIENCKYMISQFRNVIDGALVNKYEKRLYECENNLLNIVINNEKNNANLPNLEDFNNKLSTEVDKYFNNNQESVYDLLYKNIMFGSGVVDNLNLASESEFNMVKDTFAYYNDRRWNPSNMAISGNYFNVNLEENQGLVSKFNSMVFNYANTFYNQTTKKFYGKLLNEFTNKTAYDIVFDNKGIPDVFNVDDQFAVNMNNNTFISNNEVVCNSLGHVLRKLYTRNINQQLPMNYHLINDINEVSPHIVDKFKLHLPNFIRLFNGLINNCLLYKKLLENDKFKVIPSSELAGAQLPVANQQVVVTDDNGNSVEYTVMLDNSSINEESARNNFNITLNKLIEASRSIINDANTVLSELNHKYQYCELKDNFIKNFYNNTNKLPYMPMSLLSYIMNPIAPNLYNQFNSKSDAVNKFIYGVNSVINNPNVDNNINNYIWLKEQVKSYNGKSFVTNTIDVNKVNGYLDVTNTMMISLSYMLHSNKIIYSSAAPELTSIAIQPFVGSLEESDFNTQFSKINDSKLSLVVGMVENTNVDSNKVNMNNFIKDQNKNSPDSAIVINRNQAILLNIIDMNINPINIHALMREIPLINIYNYSFTFDHIINEFMHVSTDVRATQLAKLNKNIHDTSLFVKLMQDPYYNYASKIDLVNNIPNALVNSHELGVPKFIMDVVVPMVNKKPDVNSKFALLNNKFLRNILFVTNLQRIIRKQIKGEVERINTKIVSDTHVINDRITNLASENDKQEESEFEDVLTF
jgi:hypothetical protein